MCKLESCPAIFRGENRAVEIRVDDNSGGAPRRLSRRAPRRPLALAHPDAHPRAVHRRQRPARQTARRGETRRPHRHRDSRGRAARRRAAGHPARHPLRGRRPARARQGPRHGRASRAREIRTARSSTPCSTTARASSPASAESSARASSTASTRTPPAASSSRNPTPPTNRSSPSSPSAARWRNSISPSPRASRSRKGTRVFTHIGRHPVNRQKMAVVNPPGGKTAITDYEVLATDAATRHRARALPPPHRPHPPDPRPHAPQGRARCQAIRFMASRRTTPVLPDRLMLHAWKLSFEHPITGKRHSFEAPVPDEFARWMEMARMAR